VREREATYDKEDTRKRRRKKMTVSAHKTGILSSLSNKGGQIVTG
jgi:hypothetical protein